MTIFAECSSGEQTAGIGNHQAEHVYVGISTGYMISNISRKNGWLGQVHPFSRTNG